MIHAMLLALVVALIGSWPASSVAAGKDFVIGLSGDATSLNPVIATDGQSYIAEWPLFDSLVELDQGLNVKPLLAESWEVSPDGLTINMKQRANAKWHNKAPVNGRAFDASDVIFSWNRYAQSAPLRALVANSSNPQAPVLSMTATDPKTISI